MLITGYLVTKERRHISRFRSFVKVERVGWSRRVEFAKFLTDW